MENEAELIEIERQNKLLAEYMNKYFDKEKQAKLIDEFSFSELRKYMGELDIEFFARCYFPKYFSLPFGKFHRELFLELKRILKSKGTITAFGISRGCGKSTIDSFLFPLYCVLYQKVSYVLIISATSETALPFLDMQKAEITDNELLKEDFGVCKGTRWNNDEIWLKNKNGKNIACIMIRGIDGSLRGLHWMDKRPELILGDDLVKDKVASSDIERQRLKDTFLSVVLPLGTKDTNILVVGTVQNEEDLMADLLTGRISGVRAIKKSAIEQWSDRDDLWGEWRQLYNNLKDTNRMETAKAYFEKNKDEMLKGTKVLWNENLTYYYLMQKKESMGDAKFYCEYQNSPRNSDDYIFQNMKYWEQIPKYEDMKIVMFVDTAIVAKKRSDFSAISIIGQDKKSKQIFVISGLLYRLLPDDMFDRIVELCKQYPEIEEIGFEIVQAQQYMKQKLEEKLYDNKIFTPVKGIIPKGKKEERIINIQPDVSRGFILFNKNNTAYNSQIKDYNKAAKHDDAPDSLASAVNMLQEVESLKFFDRKLLF
jgi:predicted phage terminase large subunit-like protein